MEMLAYPVFVIESDGNRDFQYRVVTRKSDFMHWFNVPQQNTYRNGAIYDGSGRKYLYEGDASKLMVGGVLHTVLENLIFPSLIFKALSYFVYFGPNAAKAREIVSIDEFQSSLLNDLSRYEDETEINQIVKYFEASGNSHADKLLALEKWILSAGTRSSTDDFS